MHNRPVLDASDVRAMMLAARTEATRLGLEVSIAVVDEAGILLALERLDNARLHTPEAAWLKARTAAITRSETATLQDQADAHPAMLAFPGRLPLAGGIPITLEGVVVGGVGSSGGSPDQDLAVCHAVLAAFSALGGGVLPDNVNEARST